MILLTYTIFSNANLIIPPIAFAEQTDYDVKLFSKNKDNHKKFVCKTGQFKGFFVESLVFCNIQIASGPPGRAGPAGPQGLTGPQGIQVNWSSRSYWSSRVIWSSRRYR